MNPRNHPRPFAIFVFVTMVGWFVTRTAAAGVQKEGTWPENEPHVTFDFRGHPREGLTKLASEAGWSVVVSDGLGDTRDVSVNVKDQPADAVLDALFATSNVVIVRNGTLLTVTPGTGAERADAKDDEKSEPSPTARGTDRTVFGESLTVRKDEIVHTLTVVGGTVTIEGTVTGDLVVAGGSARIRDGGKVVGDATAFGGSIHVEKGGRVKGDVGVVGGSLKRDEGSFVGGDVVNSADEKGHVSVTIGNEGVHTTVEREAPEKVPAAVQSFGRSLTNVSLLFVLGCVLLALATRRMDALRTEIAQHPMRSMARGVVGALAAVVAFSILCITIVGIPFAILALLVLIFATYSSICAVLMTFGAAVVGHKSNNPYAHLLVGCVALLLIGWIPFFGHLATAAVTCIAIGALVSTRLAGFAVRSSSPSRIV
jgi:hypothetical protein